MILCKDYIIIKVSQHNTFLIKFDKSQQTQLKIDLFRAVIKEIREKGKINLFKSKNILITNIIKRYKLSKSYEKLNLKFIQIIDEIRSKNYHKLDLNKYLRSRLKFDGNQYKNKGNFLNLTQTFKPFFNSSTLTRNNNQIEI